MSFHCNVYANDKSFKPVRFACATEGQLWEIASAAKAANLHAVYEIGEGLDVPTDFWPTEFRPEILQRFIMESVVTRLPHLIFIQEKTDYQSRAPGPSPVTKTEMLLIADEEHILFARYFREFVNCYKYINGVFFKIPNPEMEKKYFDWIGNVNNYANNGGDMW